MKFMADHSDEFAKQIADASCRMVKKENILQLRTFQKNHGEYMI